MCGIIGCVGEKCVDKTLKGLDLLQYRGYDSAGIAVLNDKNISIIKKEGRLPNLLKAISSVDKTGSVCIGHTRWATHGKPDDRNAHPFFSCDKNFALVHNGIIENYSELKKFLTDRSFSFSSETDSEVIVDLVQYFYNGDTLKAVSDTVNLLKGSFAFALISVLDGEKIFFAKKENPLIVSSENGCGYVSSDIPAISSFSSQCVVVEDRSVGVVTRDDIRIYDFVLNKKNFSTTRLIDKNDLSLSGYPHYMKKEIAEIPSALSRAVRSYALSDFDTSVLNGIKRIVFIACGTALHACMAAKRFLRENVPEIDCYAEPASELSFSSFPCAETLFVAVSQSGETADTLKSVRRFKSLGGKIISVCNTPTSSLAMEADVNIFTDAGVEIAVASTKAYNSQLSVLFALCEDIVCFFRKDFSPRDDFMRSLSRLSFLAEKTLTCEREVADFAVKNKNVNNVFFLGRGLDYCVACEGSLKLKEISYVHSEAYPAGELKHGTLALIDDNTLVIAIVARENTLEKMLTCLSEVRSRGAKVFTVTKFRLPEITSVSDFTVTIPETIECLCPILSVIPLQLFAYYSALYRGKDIDKPRNLAKSVTVE